MAGTGALEVDTLSLPTPFAVGPVNAYVISAEPTTMIDAGVNTVDAENALKLGFAAKGLFLESVERILVTHGHPDHYGLIPTVRAISKAQAFMGAEDYARLTDSRTHIEIRRLLQQSGFPPEMLDQMGERMRNVERVHQVAAIECTPIKEGDVFQFQEFELRAIGLPGHTGGHLGYLEPDSRTLFAGDTLLPHISPNPLLEPEAEPPSRRRPSLKQYLESLNYLESLDLAMVYPGHGPPITNPNANIRYMREHHSRRLEVIAGSLEEFGTTAYEVSRRLYPDAREYNYFLALSEVVAHLDVLVQEGRAKQEMRDGVEFFIIP